MTKRHKKKVKEFEKKVADLIEFKNKKMAEEKDLKFKQRKEMKKTKQLATKVENILTADTYSNDDDLSKNDLNFNVPVSNMFDALDSQISSAPLATNSLAENTSKTIHQSSPMPFYPPASITTMSSSSSSETRSTTTIKPSNTVATEGNADYKVSEEDKEELMGHLNYINRKLDENIKLLKENTDKLGDQAINK